MDYSELWKAFESIVIKAEDSQTAWQTIRLRIAFQVNYNKKGGNPPYLPIITFASQLFDSTLLNLDKIKDKQRYLTILGQIIGQTMVTAGRWTEVEEVFLDKNVLGITSLKYPEKKQDHFLFVIELTALGDLVASYILYDWQEVIADLDRHLKFYIEDLKLIYPVIRDKLHLK
jgi:hypothetical protein